MKKFFLFLTISSVTAGMQEIHKASGLPANIDAITPAQLSQLKPTLKNLQTRTDDWPQLNYYRQANSQLMSQKTNSPRVVFLGDSIFEYWDNPRCGGFINGKSYINRGISAQTTPQILLRLRSDVINLKPHVMVLLAGVNDIGVNTGPITFEETTGNIASMAELAAAHHIKVILCSLLPTSNYHFDGKDPRGPQTVKRPLEKIRALNQWIKNYAQQHNHIYVDYFSALVDSTGMLRCELSEDDLHPNVGGYALMAPLTEEAIRKVLQQ